MSANPAPAASHGGLFITFEGIDGAGKTTHIAPLAAAFKTQGRNVLQTREPGGTPLAEKLRELALHQKMDALTEALIMFAARRDHVQQVIAPALARGEVVLCDRFADASFAYQGGGRGLNWHTLQTLEEMVLRTSDDDAKLLQPDLTLWFDLPAATAAARLASARDPDKFEAESTAFFEKVRQAYARRAAENPARFVRINAAQTPDAVWQDVLATVHGKGML